MDGGGWVEEQEEGSGMEGKGVGMEIEEEGVELIWES